MISIRKNDRKITTFAIIVKIDSRETKGSLDAKSDEGGFEYKQDLCDIKMSPK